jgi:hypothetical protein
MTGNYIQKLYEELPWEKNSSIQQVNSYHSESAKQVRQLSRCELRRLDIKFAVSTKTLSEIPSCNIRQAIKIMETLPEEITAMILLQNLKVLKESDFHGVQFPVYERYCMSEVLFSQFDMAMVQSAFFASIVIFPDSLGVKGAPQ